MLFRVPTSCFNRSGSEASRRGPSTESFPHDFGLPGEETIGPGGFANALRTVPQLRETWNEITELAPGATVVDLTNPAGIVQQAVQREWTFRIREVCNSPVTFTRAIAERLGRPVARVARRYVGLNHCGWYVPESADELELLADLVTGMDPSVVRLYEAVPAPYVRCYASPDRQLEAQRGKTTRADELRLLDAQLVAAYRAGPGTTTARRGAPWYGLAVLRLIDALVNGTDDVLVPWNRERWPSARRPGDGRGRGPLPRLATWRAHRARTRGPAGPAGAARVRSRDVRDPDRGCAAARRSS